MNAADVPHTDHLSEGRQVCLRFLQDIYEVSATLGTRTYIWGGLVIDILQGEFLRDHRDVDGFTLNLLDVKDEMAARFAGRGYAASWQDDVDILRIDKNGLHAVFNRLELEGDLAMWRHVGEQGTLFFPADWLDPAPRSFYGVPVHVSGVRFEYAIKSSVRLLNPEWKPRDKDRAALRYLSAELERTGHDPAHVLSQVWSETPFWVDKGYPEYATRITAT